jgi:hypothetical protein
VSDDAFDGAALQELATQAEQRAAKARRHAAIARERARNDAARGDREAEEIHLREADAHEGAANVTEHTAALYRNRLRRVTGATTSTGQRKADT